MKEKENTTVPETETEKPLDDTDSKIAAIANASIEQIDDSELPQSLKDKFKVK